MLPRPYRGYPPSYPRPPRPYDRDYPEMNPQEVIYEFKRKVAIPPGDIPKYLALIVTQYEIVRKMRKDREELSFVEPAYPSILLIGPPGVGKSEQVKLFAMMHARMLGKVFVDYSTIASGNPDLLREIFKNSEKYYIFVDLRLTEIEPFDILGAIRLGEIDGVRFTVNYPFLWAHLLSRCAGLLFLDELTHVQRPDTESVALKLVLDRMAGGLKFSDDVLIVAAGNDEGDSKLANILDDALLNRFIILYIREPTPRELINYIRRKTKPNFLESLMREVKSWLDTVVDRTVSESKVFDGRVFNYLTMKGKTFEGRELDGNINMMTPRSLWRLSILMRGIKDANVIKTLAYGLIGAEASSFMMFLSDKPLSTKAFLENPAKYVRTLKMDALLRILEAVAHELNALYNEDYHFVIDKVKEILICLWRINRLEAARALIDNLEKEIVGAVCSELRNEGCTEILDKLTLTLFMR